MTLKACPKCRTVVPVSGFFKKKSARTGLASWCKACMVAARAEWALQNRHKIALYDKKYYEANSETIKQKVREWVRSNPERKTKTDRAYRANNAERTAQLARDYRQRNPERTAEGKKQWKEQNLCRVQQLRHNLYWSDPERFRKAAAEFKRANRARYNSLHAQRKALKRNATPPWLTAEHRRVMQFTYDLAAACSAQLGQPYHVDHYVPLKGKGVCGLHVPWNLRAIPAVDNLRKNNELPEELQGWRRPDGTRCG